VTEGTVMSTLVSINIGKVMGNSMVASLLFNGQ